MKAWVGCCLWGLWYRCGGDCRLWRAAVAAFIMAAVCSSRAELPRQGETGSLGGEVGAWKGLM